MCSGVALAYKGGTGDRDYAAITIAHEVDIEQHVREHTKQQSRSVQLQHTMNITPESAAPFIHEHSPSL